MEVHVHTGICHKCMQKFATALLILFLGGYCTCILTCTINQEEKIALHH